MVFPLLVVVGLVVLWAAHRSELALASGFWGLTTLLAFVPAGALFSLVLADHAPFSSAAMAVVVASGIVTGVALLRAALQLRRRAPVARGPIGMLSMAHHAVVGVVIAATTIPGDRPAGCVAIVGLTALPCAVGAYLGWKLATPALSPAR
jgi:hypothetical protein